jgi:predicted permease
MDEVARDVRYAGRTFVRTPGFTVVIVLTLALGIGVNTAIFSLIDALMLRTLPVRHADELVQVHLRERGALDGGEIHSYPIVRALDDQNDIFAGAAGYAGLDFDLADAGVVTRVQGALVTGGFYQTLGVEPAAGRLLTREDDEPGAPLVAVMSDAFWARHYSRSPDAIGRTIRANGVSLTLVGVTPAGFTGATVGRMAHLTITSAALPHVRPSMTQALQPGEWFSRLVARPRPGLSPDAAAAQLNARWPALADRAMASHWSAARRQAMAEEIFVFESGATGATSLRHLYQRPLYVLMAAVSLVLLIACANVASLLLARATTRQREMAIRLAIGAGRGRIIRQLLIEGTMLSVAGAALGVAFAWIFSRFLVDLIAVGYGTVVFDLTPNWRVLGFAAAAAIVTGILFNLAPARRLSTSGFASLQQSGRAVTRRSRLLPGLVAVQVALSLVLVAGAGLFARTLANLRGVDPGFSTDDVFVVALERRTAPSPLELLEVVKRVPGVTVASLSTQTPLDGSWWGEPIVPAPQPVPETENALVVAADPRFFEAMQIARVAGRAFTPRDSAGSAFVAIVNERYAARFFAGQDPLGRRLTGTIKGIARDLEIVGMVRNTNASGLRHAAPAIVYIPFSQSPDSLEPSLSIRMAGPPAAAIAAIRSALQPLLPTSLINVRELSAQVSNTLGRERMMASLAGALGALALVLASVGLYGLLAYSVAQRTREIGIRMALGSRESGVIVLVLRTAGLLVLAGLALGLPAAWAASRWIGSMLFGLGPMDPLAIGGAIAALVAAALLATFVPARRAARVDPLVVLKQE